jgi:phosphate transport system protein
MSTHTDREFEKDLRVLREALLTMAARVETQIHKSVRSLVERDSALADKVIASDSEVNRLELAVDDLCRRILALRQPAASDLRFITTALKIVTDLERCGDLAVNVANRVLELNQAPALASYRDLPRLAELVQEQVKSALDAFVSADTAKAEIVLKGDEGIDNLFMKVFNELVAYMLEDGKYIRRATALMLVAKHLERVGDHACNIAEMVIYMVRGTDVRHPRSRTNGNTASGKS